MAGKEGQFYVLNQFKAFSINLNTQKVNGMTHFYCVELVKILYVRLLDTLGYRSSVKLGRRTILGGFLTPTFKHDCWL